MAMDLIYAESLFRAKQFTQCFEFLQIELSKFPIYSVLLFHYGKFIAQSDQEAYYGSGMGALQKCLRVCIPQRGPHINFFLGEIYRKMNRPGKAYHLYTKAKVNFTPDDKDKIITIDDYLHKHCKLFSTMDSTKRVIKTCESTDTLYSVPENKLEKLIPALMDVKYDDPITIGIMKSDVYSTVFKNKVKACKELKILMKEYPTCEEPFFKYWSLMKQLGNNKELEEVSFQLQQVCNNTNVSTSAWVESLFKHSEMLVIIGKFDEAIKTLKKICFILPPVPLPRLNYMDKNIRIKDEIIASIKSNIQNEEPDNDLVDNSLFGDDDNIKEDGGGVNDSDFLDFKMLNLQKQNTTESNTQDLEMKKRMSILSDYDDDANDDRSIILPRNISEEDYTKTPKQRNIIVKTNSNKQKIEEFDSRNNSFMANMNFRDIFPPEKNNANMSDLNLSMISHFHPMVPGRILEQPYLSTPRLSVQFDSQQNGVSEKLNMGMCELYWGSVEVEMVLFLYQIGKICAESGKFLEEGIMCMDDYINLLSFFSEVKNEQSVKPKLNKAIYIVGMAFFKMGDMEEAERFLNQIRMHLFEHKEMDKFYKCEDMLADIYKAKLKRMDEDYFSEDTL